MGCDWEIGVLERLVGANVFVRVMSADGVLRAGRISLVQKVEFLFLFFRGSGLTLHSLLNPPLSCIVSLRRRVVFILDSLDAFRKTTIV